MQCAAFPERRTVQCAALPERRTVQCAALPKRRRCIAGKTTLHFRKDDATLPERRTFQCAALPERQTVQCAALPERQTVQCAALPKRRCCIAGKTTLHCRKDERFSVLHCRKDERFSVLHCRKDDAALPERRRCIKGRCHEDRAEGQWRTKVSGGPKSVAVQRDGRRVLPAGGGRGVLQTVSVKPRHAAPHLPSRLITAHVGASATQGVPFHFNGGVTAG